MKKDERSSTIEFLHSIVLVANNFVWMIWFVRYVDQDLNVHCNIHHKEEHHDSLNTILDLFEEK